MSVTQEYVESQSRLNAEFWVRGEQVAEYSTRELRRVEAALLCVYEDALSGRVLELGCGAGRLTGYLCELSPDVHALDLSAAMVEHCRREYPQGTFSQRDLRDLAAYEDGSFDVVVAPFNVLDVLDDNERQTELTEIRRLLTAGGLLIMSSHNRAFAPRIDKPTRLSFASKRELLNSVVYMPKRVRNRRRLLAHERVEDAYAILNDNAHDYAVLHYYISRDAQERQLQAAGYELLECLDLDGRTVQLGETAETCAELHYVARRS